jgi:molecular chaperone GrpE
MAKKERSMYNDILDPENAEWLLDGIVSDDDEDEDDGEYDDVTDGDNTADGEAVALKKQAAVNLDKYQRTLAEFDNFRKRTMKEKASMYDDGVRDTVEKLLPVIDNFERAVAAASNAEDGFYKGIVMIFKQMQDFLDGLGVEYIDAVGETFDPNLHHAVAHVEDETCGEGEIVEEMQKGYKYKEKIIRCSMVKVAN